MAKQNFPVLQKYLTLFALVSTLAILYWYQKSLEKTASTTNNNEELPLPLSNNNTVFSEILSYNFTFKLDSTIDSDRFYFWKNEAQIKQIEQNFQLFNNKIDPDKFYLERQQQSVFKDGLVD